MFQLGMIARDQMIGYARFKVVVIPGKGMRMDRDSRGGQGNVFRDIHEFVSSHYLLTRCQPVPAKIMEDHAMFLRTPPDAVDIRRK